jgi:asparagine synthase (glutamine-hydrolysing)
MSGITGAFSFKGMPVDIQILQGMVDVLAHRGPDGSGIWQDGSVGFGHRLLWTTQESLSEKQPYSENGYTITADARLDNRGELGSLLGLNSRDNITDDQFILAAYNKWGETCPEKLLGDFAFAIWDSHKRILFCARDQIGVKPFYYFLNDEWFIFASEMKAILRFPQVPRRLNEAWLAEFFMPVASNLEKQPTFFQDIVRLPPAYSLSISLSKVLHYCYWSLDPEHEIRLKSDNEYSEAFREHFTEAVRCRMNCAFPIGSTLSGGLDSSSIACTARNTLISEGKPLLHTFSATFADAPDADESSFFQAVIEQGNLIPHYLHPDQDSPFIDLDQVLWHLDEAFFGINYFMPWSFYRCASENNVRVLLDGTDGDTTVSHGMDYLSMLASNHKWSEFARETRSVVQHFDHPRYATISSILYGYGAPHLTELARKGNWIALIKNARELGRQFNISPVRLVRNWGIKPLVPKSALTAWRRLHGKRTTNQNFSPFLTQEFAQQLRLSERLKKAEYLNNNPRLNERFHHYNYLTSGMLPYSLEMINRLASAFSIEVRFPFCDRRLIEFSLALPPEQKLRDGWNRFVLRQAMQGVLPEKVRWRGGKISLSRVLPYTLKKYDTEFVEDVIFYPPDPIQRYIDMDVIQKMYNQFIDNGQEENLQWVWQVIILLSWFKQAKLSW